MFDLSNLKDTHRKEVKVQRVGRGPSSGRGKTSSRGHKGAGSRSGYRRRYGYEGGQMRLYTKLPIRGFTRGKFIVPTMAVNLSQIEEKYNDGEVVNIETMKQKKLISKNFIGKLKVLANGKVNKKVSIEANGFSKEAVKKLDEKKIKYKVIK